MSDNSFPKQERISGTKRIDKLFNEGESGFVFPFRYIFLIEEGSGKESAESNGIAVLVSVSKRYQKRANKRNLLKRRTREAFRTKKHLVKDKATGTNKNISVALLYSTRNNDIAEYKTIDNAVGKILVEISKRI